MKVTIFQRLPFVEWEGCSDPCGSEFRELCYRQIGNIDCPICLGPVRSIFLYLSRQKVWREPEVSKWLWDLRPVLLLANREERLWNIFWTPDMILFLSFPHFQLSELGQPIYPLHLWLWAQPALRGSEIDELASWFRSSYLWSWISYVNTLSSFYRHIRFHSSIHISWVFLNCSRWINSEICTKENIWFYEATLSCLDLRGVTIIM